MAKSPQQFQTIRTEGALLPPDILQRVASLRVEGVRAADYHLPEGFRINDAILQSWDILKKHWQSFQAPRQLLDESETGTSLTNERWLLPLFRELAYGHLTTSPAPVIDERSYPIERFYNHSPIHLIGWNLPLDRRTKGARGAATSSPHSMVQEFLNRSDDHTWAFLSNGRQLRILRDNVALSRQAYVEFDLEGMFDGEVHADFALLWMLCHQSRVEADKPEDCWLEAWSKLAAEEGTRVLNQLRVGVTRAIEALGQGFMAHPRNHQLREKLQETGQLSRDEFYRQLLRIVYRLLFLFVAEDRELLHPPDSDEAARDLYRKYYSTGRLRDLALKLRGSRHADLWHSLALVFDALGRRDGLAELGLPGLGSFLWQADDVQDRHGHTWRGSTRDLLGPAQVRSDANGESRRANGADSRETHSPLTIHHSPVYISNEDLLTAIRALAYVEQDRVLRTVDYRNLGTEEFGSVYESLLELHPDIHVEAKSFELGTAAGNERKTTGSYYTPDSLVQCLLDSALDPVVEDRLKQARELARKDRASKGREIYASRLVSGPESLAVGDGSGRGLLPGDSSLSDRGEVRPDVADPAGSDVDSGEHRGGLGTGDNRRIHPVSANRAGQHEGTGNASASLSATGASNSGDSRAASQPGRRDFSHDDFPDWFFTAQKIVGPDSLVPYSLLAEQALLALTVCDPACGSGHFLIAAAHRLARHLARIRTGESEPGIDDYQHALRDVVGRCIYGVDLNPMAVELCRVSLWMEALEPGKPLSFLDHHIQCGNSLLGTTPALLARGIPDDAFKPIEGDVKAVASDLKKQNKKERTDRQRGQGQFEFEPYIKLGNLPGEFTRLSSTSDDSVADVAEKERRYAELVSGADYQNARLLADTWCAVFVWQKDQTDLGRLCPTENDFRRIENNPHSILPHVKSEVRRLADQYQFFHWHLAFPDVFRLPGDGQAENEQTGWNAGFDVVLGNPPWETIEFKEKEWFESPAPEIAAASTTAARRRLIANLETEEPRLYGDYQRALRVSEGTRAFARNSRLYPLCTSGKLNTFSLFAEYNWHIINLRGRVGCIIPAGVATDDSTKQFFQAIVQSNALVSLHAFDNKERLFPAIKTSLRFCLFTLRSPSPDSSSLPDFVFYARTTNELKNPRRHFTMSHRDIELLNPNSGTCPIFLTDSDAELTKAVYRRVPILLREHPDKTTASPWNVSFRQGLFNMSGDSGLFRDRDALGLTARGAPRIDTDDAVFVALFEPKLMGHFDHRSSTYDLDGVRAFSSEEKSDPHLFVSPRYWVPENEVNDRLADRWSRDWLIGWQDVTDVNTMARTVISTVIPRYGVGHTMPLMFAEDVEDALPAILHSMMDSFVFDYIARQKIGGTHLTYIYLKQLPFARPSCFVAAAPWDEVSTVGNWFLRRVLELTYTAWDLEAFALDCGYDGPPFRWDQERRFLLRCELDAAYFHLYLGPPAEWGREKRISSEGVRHEGNTPAGSLPASSPLLEMFPTPRDAVAYIMETFPIVKRKDIARTQVTNESGEVIEEGTYITKDTILEIYDEMQQAIETGQPYQTHLDPPPGPPTDSDGNFSPASEWVESTWPSHIHPPKEETDS